MVDGDQIPIQRIPGRPLEPIPTQTPVPVATPAIAPTLPGGDQIAQNFPNQGDNIGALITAATLSGQPQQQPSPGDIAAVDALIQAQAPVTEIGDPGLSLFPGLNQPINVGQIGGQIIGSQPVFVRSGGVFPAGVVQAREQALQAAAKQKAAALKPFDLPKGPTIKDPRFQKTLNDLNTAGQEDFIRRAQEQFGDKAFVALQSPNTKIGRDFLRFMDNLDVLAREGDQIIDLFGEIDAGVESGEQFFSEETLRLRDEFDKLTGDFAQGEVTSLVNLRDNLNKIKGFITVDKVLNDQGIVDDIKGRLVERAGVQDFNEYLQTTKVGTKKFEEDARTIASQLANTTFRPQVRAGVLTEDDILKSLTARLGEERTTDVKVNVKPKGIGVSVKVEDVSDVQGDPNEVKFTDSGSGQEFVGTTSIRNNIPTTGNKINMTGLQVINADGSTSLLEGAENAEVIATGDFTVGQGANQRTQGAIFVRREVEVSEPQPTEIQSLMIQSGNLDINDPAVKKKTVKKTIEQPVVFDETARERLKTDASKINVEKGAIDKMFDAANSTSVGQARQTIEGF